MEELKLQSVRKTEEARRLPGREDPAETSKRRREPRKGDGGWGTGTRTNTQGRKAFTDVETAGECMKLISILYNTINLNLLYNLIFSTLFSWFGFYF